MHIETHIQTYPWLLGGNITIWEVLVSLGIHDLGQKEGNLSICVKDNHQEWPV